MKVFEPADGEERLGAAVVDSGQCKESWGLRQLTARFYQYPYLAPRDTARSPAPPSGRFVSPLAGVRVGAWMRQDRCGGLHRGKLRVRDRCGGPRAKDSTPRELESAPGRASSRPN